MNNYETLLFERDGPLAWLTLNRPDKLNAISTAMVEELNNALDAAEADDQFNTARTIARTQSARSLELRATMDWARLLRARDNSMEARRLLAPVYEWFTEGFATPDLEAAKTLMEELG